MSARLATPAIAGSPQVAPANPAQDTIDRIILDNELHVTAYEVAIDTSRYGDGLFKIRLEKGQPIIEGQSPSTWFPVVEPGNIRKPIAHVLAWTYTQAETTFLEAEIHTQGQIEHRLYQMADSSDGLILKQQLTWDAATQGVPEVEQTKVDEFLIVPVAGLRTTDRYYGLDDYGDIISLVHELEIRAAQISRILDKHADPRMCGPARCTQNAISKPANTWRPVAVATSR